LVGNSIKYTFNGSVKIKLEAIRTTNSQPKVKLTVEDTGIGIKEEYFEHLFDIFSST